jgi:nitronate monooxygenase
MQSPRCGDFFSSLLEVPAMLNGRTRFTEQAGIQVPLICGAMYPCSNPELIAAVSEAGGIGVIQPISMTYVHGHDLREGIRSIRRTTGKPIGFNALIEASSSVYLDRMKKWVDVALDEGVRFFVTALGDPRWVVQAVHARGGVVYHDVTERKWADKGLAAGVDGLICVNARAGGHAGTRSPEALFEELGGLGVPLICAGGVGDESTFRRMLGLGYAGVQLGTRFIATTECRAHADYKNAILGADADDVVLTDKISGVPVAVIATDHVLKVGTRANPIMRRLLRHPRTKHYARMFYSAQSLWKLKRSSLKGSTYADYFQAGKSVAGIDRIEPAGDVVRRFAAALTDETTAAL